MQNIKHELISILTLSVVLFAIVLLRRNSLPFFIPLVFAHCDTLAGPVVKDAKIALEKGDVKTVLKWVKKENEEELRRAFNEAISQRNKNPETKETVDMKFFETLVRIHRAGEGAVYTGIKPANEIDLIITEVDKAMETGSVENLINFISVKTGIAIRQRFQKAFENKKHSEESVEAGREFVEAYVDFVHYVERLYSNAASKGNHHLEEESLEKH